MIPFLRRNIVAAHAIVRPVLESLSIALIGDRAMSGLHYRYMKIAAPTDVLTFELEHDARGRPSSGELAVCVPHARRAVKTSGLPLRVEVLLYCLHGMLHLSGHDDRRARDFKIMHRMEDDILGRLGFPAAFAAGTRNSP